MKAMRLSMILSLLLLSVLAPAVNASVVAKTATVNPTVNLATGGIITIRGQACIYQPLVPGYFLVFVPSPYGLLPFTIPGTDAPNQALADIIIGAFLDSLRR